MNSGDIYDSSITGGRLGVFVFEQPKVQWSYLVAKCMDNQNEALYLDGVDDYVEISNITALGLEERFRVFSLLASVAPNRWVIYPTVLNTLRNSNFAYSASH